MSLGERTGAASTSGTASKSFTTLMNAGRLAPLQPWTPPSIPKSIARPAYNPPAATAQTVKAAAPYRAPAARQAPAVQQNTPSFGIGAPNSGGMGGAPIPEPQSAPVMNEGDWLAGDGEYQNQMSEYDSTLTDFLGRLATQETDFTTDYETANRGLAQNKERGMQGVGEDFTSRGLANSGLFNNARDETEKQFEQQQGGLDTAKTRALADFGNQRKDKTAATDQAKGNAKRSSLGRMSMNQQF